MNITEYFYDTFKEEMKEILAQTQKELQEMTEEEKAERKAKLDKECEEIIRQGNQEIIKREQNISNDKVKQFDLLTVQAMMLAKIAALNININTESRQSAVITLSAGSVMLIDGKPLYLKELLCKLIQSADNIIISPEGDQIQIQLSYNLFEYQK
jgi:hypothetical protein